MTSPGRAQAACTRAPSKFSISVASLSGSSRRGRWLRSRASPASRLDISDFPTRHNYGLALWQDRIERTWPTGLVSSMCTIYYGREVTGFAQDDTGVDVELSDGASLRAEYLVGCDGGRSLIRKKAGIDFPGWDPTISSLVAEVEMGEEPEWGIRRDDKGVHSLDRAGRREARAGRGDEKSTSGEAVSRPYDDLSAGTHCRLGDGLRSSQRHLALQVHRYDPASGVLPERTGAARRRCCARAFAGWRTRTQHRRPGRGEAGMEAGPGVQGTSPESLLDTYQAERHPVGARVLQKPWRKPRSTAATNGRTPCATRCPSC